MYSCKLLQHIRCVQQVHNLATAVTLSKPDVMTTFDLFALSASPQTGPLLTLTQSAAQVAKLVLQHSIDPLRCQDPNQEQDCTLTWVQQHVYGPSAASMRLMEQVYSTSVQQAVMVREALIYILQHHLLTIRNCCYLLETARQASVGSLTQRAFELLCGNFIPVLQCHGGTLVELSKETLMLVLCSDSLQVNAEEDVCNALQHWVMHDPSERETLFGDMFVQAVRLRQMTYNQVRQIDDHPLVAQDRTACMAVARALLEMMIGAPVRQQPRQGPTHSNTADQQLVTCPPISHWAPTGLNLGDSCNDQHQSAVQPQPTSSQSLTQLSFAMHEGVRPVQREQAADVAQHSQYHPLQWRYDQNYGSKAQKQQNVAQSGETSDSSQAVQLSCSESFDMDDYDMQSCGVSKLRLGSSLSEEDVHAEAASICSPSDNDQLHQRAGDATYRNPRPSLQATACDGVNSCSSSGLQHDHAAVASSSSQTMSSNRQVDMVCDDSSSNHKQVCASSGSGHPAMSVKAKTSSGKRQPEPCHTLAEELAISPSHQAAQKRAKPHQVRKLKF